MRIETMIYIYGAICVSMILFNIVYNLLLKSSEPRLERRCRKIRRQVEPQLKAAGEGRPVEQRHLGYLRRRLCRVKGLIAFDRVLNALCGEGESESGKMYLSQIQPVILYLAVVYLKRDSMQAGYFSYFLSQYAAKRQLPMDSLQDILLDYVRKDNLYCRVNGLKALFALGNTEHILAALKLQDDGEVFLHEKILTEGLLSFTGNHDALIESLWENFDSFSVHTQLAILNYIRFQTGGYEKEMFDVMEDGRRDKELRLAAIRYFGRYAYEPALEPLLSFAVDQDPAHWEYATVSASALARYPGQRVIDTLKRALHSSNWYVRYSASQSLEAHQVDYSDMIDVIAGNDRYVREMMSYRMESRKLRKAGVQSV